MVPRITKNSFEYSKKSMTLLLSTQNLLLFHVELLMKYLWNEDDRAVIPSHCIKKPSTVDVAPKARGCKINQEHNEFLVNLVHKNACTTVSMIRKEYYKMFKNFNLSENSLRKTKQEKVRLYQKISHTYIMDRDNEKPFQLCYKIIAEWKAASVDFHKNYVFIE